MTPFVESPELAKLRERIKVLEALLRESLKEAEIWEEERDGEWGMGRSLKELEAANLLSPIVLKLRSALKV